MAALALAAVGALVPANLHAAPITVGQLFTPTQGCAPQTFLQTGVASGTSYSVPTAGVITQWSFQNGTTPPGGLKLKVGRPQGGNSYEIVGEAPAGSQTPNSFDTYPAQIPVSAGDVIGIYQSDAPAVECAINTGDVSDTFAAVLGDPPPGTTTGSTPLTSHTFPVQALVFLQPGVSSVSQAFGSISGGTSVAIAGHDFTGATAVRFGALAASNFTVNSDGQITAVSPPTSSPGAVEVAVTAPGGQSISTASDRFTYIACVVPMLKGKTLKKARKRTKANDCRLGKVKGPRSGKVKMQQPKPGTLLPPGESVRIKMG